MNFHFETETDAVANRNLERIQNVLQTSIVLNRNFVDATTGAVLKYLPDGNTQAVKDYYFMKTDVSANTVTIYPFGTQTINGAASYVLAAQYDRTWLAWDQTTQMWHHMQ